MRMSGLADEAARYLDGQIAAHRALGWDEIELRNIGGRALADLDDRKIGKAAALLTEAGIASTVAASRIGNWARPITGSFEADRKELDRIVAIAPALGISGVRIMSYPNPEGSGIGETAWRAEVVDRFLRLAETAERSGLTLLHENCAGYGGVGPEQTRDLLDAVASDRLKLLFDIGNCIYYGQDPLAFFRAVEKDVAHVQVKDAKTTGGIVRFCMPGQGEAKVPEILARLAAVGYSGIISIEPHLDFRPHEGKTELTGMSFKNYVGYGRAVQAMVEAAMRAEVPAHV
jgi:sugar phosphate isomerase/epimerase